MSKLILNDNLKAYHAELAEHIKLLQRNTAYVLDDIVNYDGVTLKCTTAGTTNTTKPNISALAVGSTYTDGTCVWTRIDPDKRGIDYWASSTTYSLNDQVVNDNKIYKCSTAHTSTSTFDATKWTEISAGGGGGISIWQANTDYEVNDVVIDSNLIWQCATAHTSTSTFDESKWICISGGEISNGLEIVPLWEGDYNSTGTSTAQQLADSVVKYEYLLITFNGRQESGWENKQTFICKVSDITEFNVPLFRFAVYAENNAYTTISIGFTDYTHFYNHYFGSTSWSIPSITSIQGIRKAKPIVSSGMKYETLWEGEAGVINSEGTTTVSLSIPYSGYKKLGITVNYRDGSSYVTKYHEFDSRGITTTSRLFSCFGYANSNYNIDNLKAIDPTTLSFSYNNAVITKIIGISEGVQIPTGVQAARVTLWEGFYNTSNNSHTSTPNYFTISDSIKNYDQFEVTMVGNKDGDNNYSTVTQIYNVADVTFDHSSSFRVFSVGGDRSSFEFQLISDTQIAITYKDISQYWQTGGITKITGIKYIQPDSYSTEEKLIGTWIDGKPLYRKVLTGLSISLGWNGDFFAWKGDLTLPINNIDTIVKSIGYGTDFCMPVTLQLNKSNNLFSIRGVDVWTINELVIEYTKN